MTRSIIGWTAALLVAGTAAAAPSPERDACSTGRIVGMRSKLFVLATARADTLRAGPGPMRYDVGDTSGLQNLRGQRFRIDRVGGDVPAELADAGTEAVLVPYGSECREVWPWPEARWAAPGRQVFADASLRPREQWVGGLPTFDVDMVHGRYPEGYTRRLDSVPANPLSPAEVFDLSQALPSWNAVQAAADSAYRPLFAWARANPGLAVRFPAQDALAEASDWLQPCLPAHDPHPIAGTYRVTVVLRGADTLRTWFRTDAAGYAECGPAPLLQAAVMRPRTADTARLYVHGAADPDAIAETNGEAWNAPGGCGVSTIEVANRPGTREGGRRGWRAEYNYLGLAGCFPGVPRVKEVTEAIFAAWSEGDRRDEPGWFVEQADGGIRFRQAWDAGGRVLLELTAERVSTRTLAGY